MENKLIDIVTKHSEFHEICDVMNELGLEYYIGAGFITQSVWNHLSGYPLKQGISDIDIVFYHEDVSEDFERFVRDKLSTVKTELWLDVKNQKRVHPWYKDKFGYDIEPYSSLEAAIDTWPTTATAVGMRCLNGVYKVYAPFGLEDMFNKIVRANPVQITEEIYNKKCDKWQKKWADLSIISWINQTGNKIGKELQ